MIKLLLVEYQPIVAFGLESIIELTLSNVNIDISNSLAEMEKMLEQEHYSIIILGPGINLFIEAHRILTLLKPYNCSSLFFFEDDPTELPLKQFYLLGLKGMVSKWATVTNVQEAIQEVYNDNIYISENLKKQIINNYLFRQNSSLGLTKKENTIATMLVNGKNNKQIGEILRLSPTTVSTFKTKIYKKLQVKNLLEFVSVYTNKKSNQAFMP